MPTTPPEITKEFNTLVFQFLWNGKDEVARRSTSMRPTILVVSEWLIIKKKKNMVKALRLIWLKKIVDDRYNSFWHL